MSLLFEVEHGDIICESTKERRNYLKGNYDDIREDLSKTDWDNELENLDVDEAWNKFHSVLESSIEKNIPLS